MPGGQFLDPGDDAGVVGDIAEGEIILDRRQVRLAPQQRVAEQSLEFGREGDRPVRQPDIMERLHAQPVARAAQAAAGVIVDADGELAVYPRPRGPPPLPPTRRYDLGIPPGP